MLRGALICPDPEVSQLLESALLEIRPFLLVRKLNRYPNVIDVVRFLRTDAPQVIFLSIESWQNAIDLYQRIEVQAPGTQIVAVNRTCDPATLLEMMRVGFRELVSPPFKPSAIQEILHRVGENLEQRAPLTESADCVYAFLPSKPGVGASTIALNTSVALSQTPNTRVLLVDFDLSCGMIGFMLQMQAQSSVVTAAENAMELDENLWLKIVSSTGDLHVLPAGKLDPNARVEPAQVRHLLEFARRTYNAICVDLPGSLTEGSIEVLHEAKRVFLVCTSEASSLYLANRKLETLRGLDLHDRITLILNREPKRRAASLEDIQRQVGLPVQLTFPNDYTTVQKAVTAGKHVDFSSELGRCFQELARSILPAQQPEAAEVKRGFLESLISRKRAPVPPARVESPVLSSKLPIS